MLHLRRRLVRASGMCLRGALFGFVSSRDFWTQGFDLQVAMLWTLRRNRDHQARQDDRSVERSMLKRLSCDGRAVFS